VNWLAQNWYIVWALFCLGAIAVALTRYRQTAPVRLMVRLWRWLTVLAVGLALFGMLLMLIGSFTVEWTCQCSGPDHWECKGASCDVEGNAHFDKYKHNMSCTRTDWPMLILGGVGRMLLPK